MSKLTRKRFLVDVNGDWRLYTDTLPTDSSSLGTITRDGNDTGALVFIHSTEKYAQVNNGVSRDLDGRKVAAALGYSGRKKTLAKGRHVHIYLDQETIDKAAEIGDGNISEGIRKGLKK